MDTTQLSTEALIEFGASIPADCSTVLTTNQLTETDLIALGFVPIDEDDTDSDSSTLTDSSNITSGTNPTILVDTEHLVWEMISVIEKTPALPLMEPSLYIDGEGENYGTGGSLYLVQIYVKPADIVYIIDVLKLGELAFSTQHPISGTSLRGILQSPKLIKVFWDVRKDSEMLMDYNVNLTSVIDIQLMALAARHLFNGPDCYYSISYCCSYTNAVQKYVFLNGHDLTLLFKAKAFGKKIFITGNFALLRQRPLPPKFIQYSAADVKYMPALWKRLEAGLNAGRFWAVIDASKDRVEGRGNTYRGRSTWRKFGENTFGIEAPWLFDDTHYIAIMEGSEIDSRTPRQKDEDAMNAAFE